MDKYMGLSIDGGGVRGIIPTILLVELEKEIGMPIYDVFDSYAGTSVGGVISSAVGVKKMRMSDVQNYMDPKHISSIFTDWKEMFTFPLQRPFYDGKGKSCLMKHIFDDTCLCSTDKTVIIPGYDLSQNKSVMFGSNKCYGYPLWKILDGCTAAPSFFPAVHLPDGKVIIDAGGSVNDPSMCLYTEMVKQDKKPCKILSIGNGLCPRPEYQAFEKVNNGLCSWIYNGDLLKVLTDTSIVDHQCYHHLKDDYCRVDDRLMFGANDSFDDCSPNNLEALYKNGKYWWDHKKPFIMKFLIS